MFKDRYKLAFALSLAVHLICVTAVEAAVFLGKVLDPAIRTPPITFSTIQSEPLRATDKPARPKIEGRILEGHHVIISEERQRDQGITRKDTSKPSDKPAVSRQEPNSLGRTFRSFSRFQLEMDRRIKKFKNHLVVLVAEKKEAPSTELVSSQIADFEKIPVEARKDLIPTYLQRMRSKIADHWSQAIGSLPEESAIAVVRFRISPEGTISALRIMSANGGESFKKSCLVAVNKANPLDPLPFIFEDLTKGRYLTVVLTFHFRNQGLKNGFSIQL